VPSYSGVPAIELQTRPDQPNAIVAHGVKYPTTIWVVWFGKNPKTWRPASILPNRAIRIAAQWSSQRAAV